MRPKFKFLNKIKYSDEVLTVFAETNKSVSNYWRHFATDETSTYSQLYLTRKTIVEHTIENGLVLGAYDNKYLMGVTLAVPVSQWFEKHTDELNTLIRPFNTDVASYVASLLAISDKWQREAYWIYGLGVQHEVRSKGLGSDMLIEMVAELGKRNFAIAESIKENQHVFSRSGYAITLGNNGVKYFVGGKNLK